MTNRLLDLTSAPADPVERIVWLDGVMAQAREELDEAYAEACFTARLQRRLTDAVAVSSLSMKRALRLTRHHNEASGRSVRWNDGLDATSTAFRG